MDFGYHARLLLLMLVAAATGVFSAGAAVHADVRSDDDGYVPGRIRTTMISEELVRQLEPTTLPDGTTFTPKLKYVTVSVSLDDLLRERNRVVEEATRKMAAEEGADLASAALTAAMIAEPYDEAYQELSGSNNCGFYIVQRFPDASFGQASHDPICSEKDPTSALFFEPPGTAAFILVTQAGWQEHKCYFWVQDQYLWIESGAGQNGFFANDTGVRKGSCSGTQNHARFWAVGTNVAPLGWLTVATPHNETWDWGDQNHHVNPNGWHIGQEAIGLDWQSTGRAIYYYPWGNSGSWGSGGYYSGYAVEGGS